MANDREKQDEPLERRDDNVGQSGRWRRVDGTENDEVARHYGHEERWHSSEHPAGEPDESIAEETRADKPNSSPYKGRFAPPEEGEEDGDDKSGHEAKSYAQASGRTSGDHPQHPDKRWKQQGGEGQGENYGAGRDAEEKDRQK